MSSAYDAVAQFIRSGSLLDSFGEIILRLARCISTVVSVPDFVAVAVVDAGQRSTGKTEELCAFVFDHHRGGGDQELDGLKPSARRAAQS